MSDTEKITVTGNVDATPEQVFALLADPARHKEIDDSGMIQGLATGDRIGAVGDTFTMNMKNDVLDEYQVHNTVTVFEPGRRIGWAPTGLAGDHLDRLGDVKPGGHRFDWELAPNGSGGATLTHTYDWSQVEDPQFKAMMPLLKKEQLAQSIEHAGRAAR